MKRTLIRLLIINCLLAAGGLHAVAQEKKPHPDEAKVPITLFKVLGPKLAIGKMVKGAPYSATAITETIQTLSDGNQIIRKNESKLYRDSEGRTRTEQTLETIGKWTTGGEAQQNIFIYDPVAGASYSLDPHARAADKNVFPQYKLLPPEAGNKVFKITVDEKGKRIEKVVTPAEFEAVAEKKRRAQEELEASGRIKKAPDGPELKKKRDMLQQGKPDASQRKIESLGTQTIEGVTAEGTRSTLMIPAGEIGNTLPIEIVDETWYSPELQIMVMTRHRDPRSGENTYRLTNLDRSEPDRSLFEIPSDYTVREAKVPPKKKRPKEEE